VRAENRVNGVGQPRFRTPDWRFRVVRFQRRNHRLTATARGLVLPVIAEWTRPIDNPNVAGSNRAPATGKGRQCGILTAASGRRLVEAGLDPVRD
jgi:hypothetical protein